MKTRDIAAREAELLGKPARMEPLDRASVADEVRAVSTRLRGGIVGDGVELALDEIPEIMFVLHRHPELWGKVMALSMQLQGTAGLLCPRDRQLAILRTAWLLQAPFEWGEHVKQSRRLGLSEEDIERVTQGPSADGWTDHERAIISAADELRDTAYISDDTWRILCVTLDERQLFELVVLIGQFTNVAYFQNSLRLRLEPGNAGLLER